MPLHSVIIFRIVYLNCTPFVFSRRKSFPFAKEGFPFDFQTKLINFIRRDCSLPRQAAWHSG